MSRRICFVTGSRADYGHLAPVMSEAKAHPGLTLQTVVTGQHLDTRYGGTWEIIAEDGYTIDDKADLALGGDSRWTWPAWLGAVSEPLRKALTA